MVRQDPTHLGKIVLCNSYSSIQLALTSTVFCYKGPKILKGFYLFYFIPIYEKLEFRYIFIPGEYHTFCFLHIYEESISLAFSFDSDQNFWSSVSFLASMTVSSAYRRLFMVCPPIFIHGLWSMFLNIISV